MSTKFKANTLKKPISATLLTLLSVAILSMTGCGGERSEAKNGTGSLTVNTPAQITNTSKDNYDDNVNGLITHTTLKGWLDNWDANKPKGINGKLVVIQQGKGSAGANFIKPNNKNTFTYADSGWLETRNNGVMNIPSIVLSGASIDRLIRKYGIDVNNDMIVCAQGAGSNGAYMNQGRCWFTLSYWGVPQNQIAVLNGNNDYLLTALGEEYFADSSSPIISRQVSSVKDLKADNTALYASIEDVINVLPLTDAPDNGDGIMLWDARSLPQYSAGKFEWKDEAIIKTEADGSRGFQNSSTRQSHPRGAFNLEFTNMLDAATGLYYDKATLEAIVKGGLSPKGEGFVSGGTDESYKLVQTGNAYQPGDTIIHYCETSMRAGVTIIPAAVVLGIPSRLYDSAMIEWNSLTADAKDKRGFTILPSNSPWDTSVLSQPSVVGKNIAPRTAVGWAPEQTRKSIESAIFKKAEADKGDKLDETETKALNKRLAGLTDEAIKDEADTANLSYEEFDAEDIAENLSASPMVTNAFAENVNLIPETDKAYKAPVEKTDNSSGSSSSGAIALPQNACGG